jgi:N-acetylneuraminic acid mutarotase
MWSQPKVCGDIPGARDGHSACVINNCMYVFGGYEEDTDQFSQDVHMLDLKKMEWRHLKIKVNILFCACSLFSVLTFV